MKPSPDAEWGRAQEYLQRSLRPSQYHTWFQGIQCLGATRDAIQLAVPSRIYRDWIVKNYSEVIHEAVRLPDGEERSVEFVIRPVEASPPPRERGQGTPGTPGLNPLYTFRNFVTGPENRLAHAAALAVAETQGTAYNPLFLHATAGLGKTHLLQATAHAVLETRPGTRLVYLSCEAFVNDFISAIAKGGIDRFRSRYRHVDYLLLDDVQFLARKDRTQEEFFHTFNTLYNAQKQIILTSDSPPREIPTLEERLVSRFKWGLVTHMEPPRYETRMAILQAKSCLKGKELPASVAEYIARRIESNVRELEGAINKLLGYAALAQKPITLGLAREALRDTLTSATPEASITDIYNEVTTHFDLRPSDILSKKRSRSIVFPRQISMYLARELTALSLSEIGEYFGGRDHTTVLYSAQKIQRLSAEDSRTREVLDILRKKIQGGSV